ncbi:solute carrier family 28 member 3-like [Ostrea edulis]|uniref:solute carrier family 28 member 3-like n=1 Tax=Ostrea edulis TaxID=37623 RepID=UPI0024AF6DDD|nr:solute carrier family 28 member 3-like [Ostrea edulis]XP_056008148.1 solute carrier family 28 member 3-like [Ostrea edulis]XP_056008149.1 solute carrier family 28 member 3-like [Ostrea edulis]
MNVELKSLEMKSSNGGEINHGYTHTENDDRKHTEPTKVSQIEISVTQDKEDEEHLTGCAKVANKIQTAVGVIFSKYGSKIKLVIKLVLLLLYFAYLGYAMYYRFGDEGSIRLLVCSIIGVIFLLIHIFQRLCESSIGTFCQRIGSTCKGLKKTRRYVHRFLMFAVFVFLTAYIIVDVLLDYPENAVSIAGLAIYIILFYVFSKNPAKINWRPVFWGFAIQYIFALIILRTQWGYGAFQWLGDRITEFLNYSNAGAIFVFGELYTNHFFAFKVLPVVVFFYTVTSVLYYLGVMQVVVKRMGMFLSFCLGTTPAESLNAAGNIFVGMTEAPLMIQPFLEDMTKSELHAVLTGGFATIAGSVLGAYINFGVPANHLISASVMSAPAALAISKLAYPETERSKTKSNDYDKMGKSTDRNVIEAISSGAGNSVKVVAAIAVNVMAFLCVLEFVNMTLTWFGDRVGVEHLSFQLICSYVFYPIAFFMGTEVPDCRRVAELIGIKTFTNEFVAYTELSHLIENKKNFTDYTAHWNSSSDWYYQGEDIILPYVNQTLKNGIISAKSEVIATYALCGFSNFGSMGIFLGGMSALVPSRRGDLSKLVLRAMIAGNVACFLTGCIAGLLYKDYGST